MKKTGFQITFDDGVTQTEYLQAVFENDIFEDVKWIDNIENYSIASAEFNDSIRVFIKVNNIILGEKVKLELYAGSHGVFDSGSTIEYEAEVVNKLGHDYAIFDIELISSWKINNPKRENNIIDTLYAKVSYNNKIKDFNQKGLDLVSQKLNGFFFKKGNDEAYYYRGELYTPTDDRKGMIPYAENPRRQFRETKEALDLIYSRPNGQIFIDNIYTRSNPNFITITRKNGANNTLSRKVSWSPGDNSGGIDELGNTRRPPFLSLAHELWHAWENWSNPSMENPVWIPANAETGQKAIVRKELTASEFENTIRVEHGISRRKWYSYAEDESGKKTGIGQIF